MTDEDAKLAAAREAFPGWDFRETFGGWLAVPSGTPVVRAMDLDGIVAKLRDLNTQNK